MSTPYYNANHDQPVIVQGYAVNNSSTTIPTVNAYEPPNQQKVGAQGVPQATFYDVANPSYDMTSPDTDLQREEQPKRCQDALFAVLFYAHLVVIAWVAATYVPQMSSIVAAGYAGDGNNNNNGRRMLVRLRFLEDGGNSGGWNFNNYNYNNNNNNNGGDNAAGNINIDLGSTVTVVVLCGLSALVLSTLALGFMIAYAETLIKVGIVFSIILSLLSGLLSLAVGQVGGAIMGLMVSALMMYYACRVWNRIPFAAANLVTATTAVRANLGLAFYAYLSLFLTFGWAVWWTAGTISAIFVLGDCQADGTCNNNVNGFLLFLFFISYYWTVQVIGNVVHVTTAGTVGHWWMAPSEAASCCSQAVRDSYVRSMTYSFGSICMGSLIVAIISATREMMHQVRESGDSMLACCAECILSCIESLVEYFNKWAFVFVGVYGMGFMEAGSNVMTLFRSRGWTTIITDDLTDRALLIVSFCVGILNGLLGILLGSTIGMGEGVPLIIPFIIGLITGLSLCSTLFSVVGSGCNTVIVLYAEKPNEFQANHPELSNNMRESWRQAWPVEFKY